MTARIGYAKTTIADITSAVGIAEGNLWYYFRPKREPAGAIEEEVRREGRAIQAAYPSGRPVADDYVEAAFLRVSGELSART